MRYLLMGWVCLAAVVAAAAPEFTSHDIQVGQKTFALPVPKELQWVARDTPWAKERIETGENLAKDPRMNVTFVMVMIKPAQYAEAAKAGRLDSSFSCWACVPTPRLEKQYDVAQFHDLMDSVAGQLDSFGGVASQMKDDRLRKIVEGFSKVALLDRTDRSLQTMTRNGHLLVASTYVLVEGKALILFMQRPKEEARELMADMDAWVAEILKQTKP